MFIINYKSFLLSFTESHIVTWFSNKIHDYLKFENKIKKKFRNFIKYI